MERKGYSLPIKNRSQLAEARGGIFLNAEQEGALGRELEGRMRPGLDGAEVVRAALRSVTVRPVPVLKVEISNEK